METYIVGGAVRDRLLGLPVKDHDYVVVGATPDDMIARGFTPVGKDFPVFLHPVTHEEYALARTERKTAPGYQGFVFHTAPDVTLEQDLIRRDLTINAIAQAEDGTLLDPFGGQKDLQAKIFRHVSPAFAEDPVRILRIARFAARFEGFMVAPETNALMRKMVDAGEVDALVPERVWQELSRGLMESRPSRMLAVLRDCGALARILPEFDALWSEPPPASDNNEAATQAMMVVDATARKNYSLPIRFAALTHDLGAGATRSSRSHVAGQEADNLKSADAVCRRLKVPNECRGLALMAAREHGNVIRAMEGEADDVLALLVRCDAFRKPQRFMDLLRLSECVHLCRAGSAHNMFPQAGCLETALKAAQAVDAGEIAKQYADQPQRIPGAIRAVRIEAVRQALSARADSACKGRDAPG
jgi:tRNA nucleotidyltransferase (CCA-adding enzyme)